MSIGSLYLIPARRRTYQVQTAANSGSHQESAFDHVLIMDDAGKTRYGDLSLNLRKHGELDDVPTGIGRLHKGTYIYDVKWGLGRQGTTQ